MAALAYAVLTAAVIGFLLALACGAPWGELTMGGKFRGRLPLPMRLACVLQSGVLALLAALVVGSAGLAGPARQLQAQGWVWAAVAFCAVSVVLNLATPSRRERMLWAPVAGAMLFTSTMVALGA